MGPPVKPEGDVVGWGCRMAPVSPRSLSSFAGLTGESICGQRAGGAMDPSIKPEGDGGVCGAAVPVLAAGFGLGAQPLDEVLDLGQL